MSKTEPSTTSSIDMASRLAAAYSNWKCPDEKTWWTIQTLDTHTEGEPLRIFISGLPTLEGNHILDRRRDARDRYDHIRRLLMLEPRGHADMYGAWLLPPNNSNTTEEEGLADFGVLFLHNEGYSSMCGHGIISLAKVAVELGLVEGKIDMIDDEPTTIVKIDAPAGRIVAYAHVDKKNLVSKVSFDNVPSFVVALDQMIWVDEALGDIAYDLAFGGAYYAYVNVNQFKETLELIPAQVNRLIDIGMRIKRAIMSSVKICHPAHEDLSFLYGTIFVGEALNNNQERSNHSRNVCIFADGEVDRSPTGTGVSGRAAIHHARGELPVGQSIVIESILGTAFSVTPLREASIGDYKGIVPRVSGTAHITGKHEFVVDPNDPLKNGFVFR